MKTRKGFVSNSSSSSFVIGKYFMNDEQINEFRDVVNEAEGQFGETYINEDKNYFIGELSQHSPQVTECLRKMDLVDKCGFGD